MPVAAIVGKLFGRLRVIERVPKAGAVASYWLCRCKCGNTREVRVDHLTHGRILSCGCFNRERQRQLHTRHGFLRHGGPHMPEYRCWCGLRNRCNNPNNPKYKDYGGRGIRVCRRWDSFLLFFQDMGRKPSPQHSIDRIKNDKGYSPNNCRWATPQVQRNNRRSPALVSSES